MTGFFIVEVAQSKTRCNRELREEEGSSTPMGRSINWQDAVSGSAAGAVSKTATAPLERVKMVSPGDAKDGPIFRGLCVNRL